MATAPVLQQVDPGDAYQALYDALGEAYWDASDIASKDLVHGAQEAVGDILDAIDKEQLAADSAAFLQLQPKIDATNEALKTIQKDITAITKNISTAAKVISAIAKVLPLFP